MSSQLARLVSSQSWYGAPVTCTPSGITLTAIFGKVMAGAPSAEERLIQFDPLSKL